jgi:hypothetical protein
MIQQINWKLMRHHACHSFAADKDLFTMKKFLFCEQLAKINFFSRNLLILCVNKIFVTFLRIFSLSTTIGSSKMGMFPLLMGIMHGIEKSQFSRGFKRSGELFTECFSSNPGTGTRDELGDNL